MKSWRLGVSVIFVLLSVSAQAEIEIAGALGVRFNSGSTDVSRATVTPQSGVMAGLLAWVPIFDQFGIRSGFTYNQRYLNLGPTNQGDVEIRYSYFDLPLTVTYQFNAGPLIYAGPLLAFNQSKEVNCSLLSTCASWDVKSFLVPWQTGLDFKLTSAIGVEIFVEAILGELSRNVSELRSAGINLLFFF